MPRSQIDHITITSPTLADGAALVKEALGVAPQAGGEHPRMGTHNLLLRLGDTVFLEVISPNPSVPAPQRPRWFALDRLESGSRPRLATWVVRTGDIHETVAAGAETLGRIEPMQRGALDWLITIPEDGSLPVDGVGPALIEWETDTHPASGLQDHGLELVGMELFHPVPERITRLLQSLGLEGDVAVRQLHDTGRPYLVAHINTPHGMRTLSGASDQAAISS
ncbi:VOC family protein [Noviherbaspirillum sp.]|uniref:VOC family protein n=1 Tax=Noviherbaspirillum sp. TaxID=1926288 RepID=UPI002FE1D62C